MRVVVLGAGVIGTTTAWYLQQAGHQVVVLDRLSAAGMDTSFANGSQISVSHAEPWANPHVLPLMLKWLGREDAPLRVHWHWDADFFGWGWRFLRECWPHRTEQNIRSIVHLALYSRLCLQNLRATLPLDYDALTKGILHIYTDAGEFARARTAAAVMNSHGLDRQVVSADECVGIEPALNSARSLLVGGDYTASDESGDAHRFTQQLATHASAAGVEFRFGAEIERLRVDNGRVCGVTIQQNGLVENLMADACVVALGSESPKLVAPLRLHLPIYPAKGYSATLELAPGSESAAPTVSLTDDGRKIVFSRLGNRLRVAGTAEFNGFNRDLDPIRCKALMTRTQELFPALQTVGEANYWCGLRPATPSNVPLVGGAGIPGLWLNTGHGTLGWTMACGSAAALTALINGQPAPVDFPFRRVDR